MNEFEEKTLLFTLANNIDDNHHYYARCPKCEQQSLQSLPNRTFRCKECGYEGEWKKFWSDLPNFSSIVLNDKEKTFTLLPHDENFITHARKTREKFGVYFNFPLKLNELPNGVRLGWYNDWWVFHCLPTSSAIIIPDHTLTHENPNYDDYYKFQTKKPQIYVPNLLTSWIATKTYIVFNVINAITLFKYGFSAVAIVNKELDLWLLDKEFRGKELIFLPLSEDEHRLAQELTEKLERMGTNSRILRLKLPETTSPFYSILTAEDDTALNLFHQIDKK